MPCILYDVSAFRMLHTILITTSVKYVRAEKDFFFKGKLKFLMDYSIFTVREG